MLPLKKKKNVQVILFLLNFGVLKIYKSKSRLFGLHVFLCFSGRKFLINLRWQYRVRKIFRAPAFVGFAVFSFCV